MRRVGHVADPPAAIELHGLAQVVNERAVELDALRIAQVDHAGAEGRGLGPGQRCLDQPLKAAGRGDAVVVENQRQTVAGALDDAVAGGIGAVVLGQRDEPDRRELLGDQLPGPIGRGIVGDQHRDLRVILGVDCGQCPLDDLLAVARDHPDDERRQSPAFISTCRLVCG